MLAGKKLIFCIMVISAKLGHAQPECESKGFFALTLQGRVSELSCKSGGKRIDKLSLNDQTLYEGSGPFMYQFISNKKAKDLSRYVIFSTMDYDWKFVASTAWY